MTSRALNIVGQAYADETAPLASQESINWFPESVETDGTRSVIAMKGTPGLQSFGLVGTGTVRGSVVMGGVLYVVADTQLYSVASDGTATSLGTVSGTGRVSMAQDGTYVVLVNGALGWTYKPSTSTFAQITAGAFYAADTVAWVNQVFVFNRSGTGQFFWSGIADPTAYNALDFATAEAAPDNVLGVLADHGELWVFGSDSVEVRRFIPFSNLAAVIQRGCASAYSFCAAANTVFWLGSDGVMYVSQGYNALRISTRPIEQALGSETLSSAFMFAYEDNGHAFICLTFPSGKTWVYDYVMKMWHRRQSYNMTRWRANTYIRAYNKHLVGDINNGQLWEMRHDVYTEGSDPLIAERKTQFFSQNQDWIYGASLELVLNSGVGTTSGDGSSPVVEMRYSDDGGRNFSTWRWENFGRLGEYNARVFFSRLGRFRSRLFHIRISSPVRRDLIAATGDADVAA